MRLRHIEIFHAVYVSGSVSGAARALNVSQPTVSKVLRHAEGQLGFDLFHREKGRIFPTEKGKLLFEQILPVFEQINELRKYATVLSSSHVGQLRLAMTPAFSLEIVPCSLAKFVKIHEDVSIEVETLHAMEISRAISNNLIDIGLAMEAVKEPGLTVTNIGTTEFVCVAPKSFGLKGRKLSLVDLEEHSLIQLNAKSSLGQMLNAKLLEVWGSAPRNQIMAETYHLAKRLAAQGAGIAIIDAITAYSDGLGNLTVHKLSDFGAIKVDLISRRDEPIVGYKADFLKILQTELKTAYKNIL